MEMDQVSLFIFALNIFGLFKSLVSDLKYEYAA